MNIFKRIKHYIRDLLWQITVGLGDWTDIDNKPEDV